MTGALGLGVLVNNVGNYVRKPLLELDVSEWHEMFDSNLHSVFYTCRAALPILRAAGYGRIVNIGYAGAQHLLARPGIVPYVIAKSGVIAPDPVAIAKSEAGSGISANVVSPGVIETSVSQPHPRDSGGAGGHRGRAERRGAAFRAGQRLRDRADRGGGGRLEPVARW